jgi:hypothetical protein
MALQGGFRRVPGASGHGQGPERFYPPAMYSGPVGEDGSVSRRQMRNWVSREAGFSSQAAYESMSRTPRFRRFAEILAGEEGVRPNAVKGPGSQFTEEFRSVDWEDKRPHGSLAKFLEYIGVREPNASYPVGGSPKAGK